MCNFRLTRDQTTSTGGPATLDSSVISADVPVSHDVGQRNFRPDGDDSFTYFWPTKDCGEVLTVPLEGHINSASGRALCETRFGSEHVPILRRECAGLPGPGSRGSFRRISGSPDVSCAARSWRGRPWSNRRALECAGEPFRFRILDHASILTAAPRLLLLADSHGWRRQTAPAPLPVRGPSITCRAEDQPLTQTTCLSFATTWTRSRCCSIT